MKIVFFGTPSFVDPVLKQLEENFEVVSKVREPREFKSEAIEELKNLNADLFVVAAYGQIMPGELLEIPRLGTINIHPSLLPKYRGASPIQEAVLNGDKITGVTFIKMDSQVDHGPIISQFEEEVSETDTFESLAKRLFEKSAERLKTVITGFSQTQTGTPQDDSKATFTKILTKEDGFIEVSSPPGKEKIDRMIRAYFPWPGVWTKFALSEKETVIKLLPNEQIQVEGKKPMNYKDFMNGYEKGGEFLGKLSLN